MGKGRGSLSASIWPIFIRLPLGFLAPFIGLLALWTLAIKPVLQLIGLPWPTTQPLAPAPDWLHAIATLLRSIFAVTNLYHIAFAFMLVGIYLTGAIAIYNIAVAINWLAVKWKLKRVLRPVARPYRPAPCGTHDNPFGDKPIGIVLAGGGAKGAFQAGAMRSVYRFLADRGALGNVKVIAGTSIGSWNALFWLADLIEPEDPARGASTLKTWWESITLRSLVAPSWYVPGLRNAFFEMEPWRQGFDALFRQPEVAKRLRESKIHFYLVRHQVDTGTLACTTNNPEARALLKGNTARAAPTVLSPEDTDAFIDGVKTGVFASMDLPPLFPYIKIGKDFFEDGGVIDNLPIMFAAMENCEIVFVLPLNADFSAEPDHRSVIKRFLRVMDVRQGALEQNSLKGVYLFNELAALRDHIEELKRGGACASAPASKTLDRALGRRHKELRVVAVCPQRSFVEATLDTQEIWKASKAAFAFETMENATAKLLASDDLDLTNERIEIFEVDRYENWKRNSNF